MRKILLILAIISIATSCGMTTTKNTPESTEVIEPTEAVYEENFNTETFKAILQQLNLKSEECYLRFVSEQVVSENESLTIWLVPKITFYEKDEYGHEAFNLDSYVLLAYKETERDGKIFCKPLEFDKIKCYYYGKTLAEVYQFIYNENKNDKQQYMLPQLPEEDRRYEMKDNNNDNTTISYLYGDNKSLNIVYNN